jgi:hypothetical protein
MTPPSSTHLNTSLSYVPENRHNHYSHHDSAALCIILQLHLVRHGWASSPVLSRPFASELPDPLSEEEDRNAQQPE